MKRELRTNQTVLDLGVTLLLAPMLLAGCGQAATASAEGGPDVALLLDIHPVLDGKALGDGGPEGDPDADAGADPEALAGDGPEADGGLGAEAAATNCEFPAVPQAGEAGAACSVATDCNSGLCVEAPKGKVCSFACIDCCPSGFVCQQQGQGGLSLVCMAAGLALCRPCHADAECKKNGNGALCVRYGDNGSFCGSACGDGSDCAPGYACKASEGVSGAAGKQCVLASGECPCSDEAIAAAASTTCHVSNAFGSCSGVRSCGAGGLSPCPAASPAEETCGDGKDNDCDGQSDEIGAAGCTPLFADSDKDGEGKLGSAAQCACGSIGLYTAATASDCDDQDAAIWTGAAEACDGLDNNCNGKVDEGCDDDGDGYCNAAKGNTTAATVCVKGGGDCSDSDPAVHPDQVETCGNFKDDNCDGLTDSGSNVSACVPFFLDGDSDGFGVGVPVCQCGTKAGYTAIKGGDCDDGDPAAHPGQTEGCNGKDDDCNGQTDEPGTLGCNVYFVDGDGDGFGVGAGACLCAADALHPAVKAGDCDDTLASISPSATETCNSKDDDCDGATDEPDAGGCTTYFADGDGDGFGDPALGSCLCATNAAASTKDNTDCNDNAAAIHPGKQESCNGIDDDCDGSTDGANTADCLNFYADGDGDGWGLAGKVACQCAATLAFGATQTGDCDDAAAAVHPGASEACDGIDNNCLGGIDEEGASGCATYMADKDGDGYGADKGAKCLCAKGGGYTSTVPGDCDDKNKFVKPKALEICDGIDNDCDGVIDPVNAEGCNTWYVDSDGDGFGTYGAPAKCFCDGQLGYASVGGDCNDGDAAVNPGATEVCNGKDDDCDASKDPNGTLGCTVYYGDVDGDGYGVSNVAACACAVDGLFSATQGGDCNDAVIAINPGATEACNGKDDNCNGQTDESLLKAWYLDGDGDGYGTGAAALGCAAVGSYTAQKAGDCNDAAASIHPEAPELCNAVDDNCNSQVDEGGTATKYFLDGDGDGFGSGGGMIVCGSAGAGYTALVGGDCDDGDADIHPGGSESCNGKDDDCNGQTDEGLATGTYYKDLDGDGFGAGAVFNSCGGAGSFVTINGDCNDGAANVFPGAMEVCDGSDNDCNGATDEGLATSIYFADADKDGYGIGSGVSACAAIGNNTAAVGGDCNDGAASAHPGAAEVCKNGIDDNCDGAIDENCIVPTCSDQGIDDFEAGGAGGWNLGGGWSITGWAAKSGALGLGFGNGSTYPSQADATLSVTVPDLATSLEFDYYAAPDIWEFCSLDHLRMFVDNLGYTNVGPCSAYAYGWIHYTLHGFGSADWGTTHTLRFRVTSDVFDNNGFFRVDNIKWGCN